MLKYRKQLKCRSSESDSTCSPKSEEENVHYCPDNSKFKVHRPRKLLPIPRGNSFYALAKQAECLQHNLAKAEIYYNKAIFHNDRAESAVKDLSSLLHQQGKTQEACTLLITHKSLFSDLTCYTNLLSTFQKQLTISKNMLNKNLKISNLPENCTEKFVKNLFENSVRIKEISFFSEKKYGKITFFCVVKFNSHSSARKTLESFLGWSRFKVQWVSANGEVIGEAHYAMQKISIYRKLTPTFDYMIFDREDEEYLYCVAVDNFYCSEEVDYKFEGLREDDLLGKALFAAICD